MLRYIKKEEPRYWETEFFAISAVTGELKKYDGLWIRSENAQRALQFLRINGYEYLQITGKSLDEREFLSLQNFKGKLDDIEDFLEMDYDEFTDWLGEAVSKEDILEAREMFLEFEDLDHFVKVIDVYLKDHYGESDNNNKEDNNKEEEEGFNEER